MQTHASRSRFGIEILDLVDLFVLNLIVPALHWVGLDPIKPLQDLFAPLARRTPTRVNPHDHEEANHDARVAHQGFSRSLVTMEETTPESRGWPLRAFMTMPTACPWALAARTPSIRSSPRRARV